MMYTSHYLCCKWFKMKTNHNIWKHKYSCGTDVFMQHGCRKLRKDVSTKGKVQSCYNSRGINLEMMTSWGLPKTGAITDMSNSDLDGWFRKENLCGTTQGKLLYCRSFQVFLVGDGGWTDIFGSLPRCLIGFMSGCDRPNQKLPELPPTLLLAAYLQSQCCWEGIIYELILKCFSTVCSLVFTCCQRPILSLVDPHVAFKRSLFLFWSAGTWRSKRRSKINE